MRIPVNIRANAIALLALLSCPPGHAAPDRLRVLYSSPQVIPVLASDAEVTLPVAIPAGTAPSANCLQKAGVRPEGGSDTQLLERFEVKRALRELPDTAPSISLTVKDVATLAPGKYELMLYAFDCAARAPAKGAEPLVIQLTRPAAKLEQPGKIVIERWLASPWSGTAYRQSPAAVTLNPANATSPLRIRALSAQPSVFTTGTNNAPVGRLTVQPPANVEPGAPVDVAFLPTEFPVGSATGHVTLRGRDLAEPLQMDVEIRSRLAPGWIIGIVICGIVLGWAVRVWLQRKIDLATARQPALAWLQSVRTEWDRVPDPEFRRISSGEIAAMEAALESTTPADAANALAKSAPVLDKARQDLNSRLATAARSIKDFVDSCDVLSPLPEPLTAIRSEALAAGAAATKLLAPPNPTAAVAALDTGRRRLLERLPGITQGLRDTILELRAALAPLTRVMDESLANQFGARLATVDAIYAALDDNDPAKLLRDAARLVLATQTLLRWSADTLEKSAAAFDTLVRSRQPRKEILAAERDELRAQLLAYAAAIRAQADGGHPVVTPCWNPASKLWIEKGEALLDQVADARSGLSPEPEAIAAFRKLVADGQWYAALKQLSPGWETQHTAPSAIPAATALPPEEAANEPAISFGNAHIAMAAPAAGVQTPPHLDAQRNATQRARAETAMSVIVAVILVWASFAFYEEKFIGTWGELLALFFWGFSADLSAQKLTEKIQASGMLPK